MLSYRSVVEYTYTYNWLPCVYCDSLIDIFYDLLYLGYFYGKLLNQSLFYCKYVFHQLHFIMQVMLFVFI